MSGLMQLMDHKSDLSRETAAKLCRHHLKELPWTTVTPEDIDLQVIPQGFVNRIFICSNTKSGDQVLIRLYGGKIVLDESYSVLRNHGMDVEVLTCFMASKANVGPALLGVFKEGRIEEYFEGVKTLDVEHFDDQSIVGSLARQLARLHCLNCPVDRTPKDYVRISWDTFHSKWESFKMYVKQFPGGRPEDYETVDYDFLSLIDWFGEMMKVIPSKVVFSHNDMNRTNFLVLPEARNGNRVVIVDYEICAYNFRGCDIGSHFKNRTIDVRRLFQGKNAYDTEIEYPSEDERRFFVREYLSEVRKQVADNEWNDKTNTEEHLLLESELYGLMYHFFFAVSFMIRDHEKHLNEKDGQHPGVMLGFFISDIVLRKNNVLNLFKRVYSQ